MGEINMLVAKFVDNNYICDNISYANFGTPIEKVILVLPINEDVDINSIKFKEKAILLEISEENIINCKRNSSFKVNEAIPIRYLNDDELSILKSAACRKSEYAYKYAYYVDQKPTNETRTAACKNPSYAYYYARYVDKKPTDETRSIACQIPHYAFYYAKDVDKKPTDKTRTNASKDPYYKEQYTKWEKSIC
jgi:hypothetical protein